MNVPDKQTMYRMLDAGAFGNTTKMWLDLELWKREHQAHGGDLWGVRSASTSGHDKRTKLDVPTAEVVPLFAKWYPNGGGQLSPMVDHMMTARMHIHESPDGIVLWLVEGRPDLKWRPAFASAAVHHYGTVAKTLLRRYLNPNSFDDLMELLDNYPNHIVELTALDRCFGRMPHRNAVIWEVRNY